MFLVSEAMRDKHPEQIVLQLTSGKLSGRHSLPSSSRFWWSERETQCTYMNEFHSWTQKSPPVIGVAAHDQMFYFASRLSETKINYGHINNIFTKVLFSALTCVMGKLLYKQVTDETWVMISPAAFFHPKILYLPLNINFWLVFNKQVNTLREAHIMF